MSIFIVQHQIDSFSDTEVLAHSINKAIFADLLRHKPFQDVKVLDYYVTDDNTHYFVLKLAGRVMCESCQTFHPVFVAITVSDFEYGISEFIAHENYRILHHDYKTVYDVISFIEEHTHALKVPSLL